MRAADGRVLTCSARPLSLPSRSCPVSARSLSTPPIVACRRNEPRRRRRVARLCPFRPRGGAELANAMSVPPARRETERVPGIQSTDSASGVRRVSGHIATRAASENVPWNTRRPSTRQTDRDLRNMVLISEHGDLQTTYLARESTGDQKREARCGGLGVRRGGKTRKGGVADAEW